MKTKTWLTLLVSHSAIGVLGFILGIYVLPILIAPPPPSEAAIADASAQAQFSTRFHRNLKGSDAFHWGEGTVSVSPSAVSLRGELAPGPDYKLYFSPEFVETEEAFERVRPRMSRVGDVKTFDNFLVAVPDHLDPADYTTVVVWCETFGEFITSARFK